ncbi:MAG: hypothetical protein ACM3MD_11370 [Betaproteobacteria bacterium]
MIRPCVERDFERIYAINDSAAAYKGVIPDDVRDAKAKASSHVIAHIPLHRHCVLSSEGK